jgi:hypothetical protein
MKDLRKMYRLEYFIEVKGRSFFMISYKANFLSDGLICYCGEMKICSADTTLSENFEAEIHAYFTRDSVKVLFDKMVNDSTRSLR